MVGAGALLAEAGEVALVDADGERHRLPVPPWGGRLIKAGEPTLTTPSGGPGSVYTLFVADENGHPLVRLPHTGFDDDVLDGFAAAAGLAYEVQNLPLGQMPKAYPDLAGSLELREAVHDREQRAPSAKGGWRRLLGRRHDAPSGADPVADGRSGRPVASAPGPVVDLTHYSCGRSQHPVVEVSVSMSRNEREAALAETEAGAAASVRELEWYRATLARRMAQENQPHPPSFSVEAVLHLTVALGAAGGFPHLISAHDDDDGSGGAGGAEGPVARVDLRVETGGPRTIAGRLAEAQAPLPVYDGGGRGYRFRAAFELSEGRPRLVAIIDEVGADASGVAIAAPAGDPGLPGWWREALAGAGEARECILAVARDTWARLPASAPDHHLSAFLL